MLADFDNSALFLRPPFGRLEGMRAQDLTPDQAHAIFMITGWSYRIAHVSPRLALRRMALITARSPDASGRLLSISHRPAATAPQDILANDNLNTSFFESPAGT